MQAHAAPTFAKVRGSVLVWDRPVICSFLISQLRRVLGQGLMRDQGSDELSTRQVLVL